MAHSLTHLKIPNTEPGSFVEGKVWSTTISQRLSDAILPCLLVASVAVFTFFTVDQMGYLTGFGFGSLRLPGLLAVLLGAVVAEFVLGKSEVSQLTSALILVLNISIPVNRADNLTQTGLRVFLLVEIALAVMAFRAGCGRPSCRTLVLLAAVTSTTVFSTVVSGSSTGYAKLVLALVPALGMFLAACRLDQRGSRNISTVLVTLATIQAGIAIIEPWLIPGHIWPQSALSDPTEARNLIVSGLIRSQGTMGHPLPLGFLLVAAVALMLRVVRPPLMLKVILVPLLTAGVVMAGSRNGLIMTVLLLSFFPGRRLKADRAVWAILSASIALLIGLLLNRVDLGTINDFADSKSYTHRVGALDAVSNLLSRQDTLHVLAGNGFDGIQSLFSGGLLQTDGLAVVDNQYIAQFVQGGLLGLIALLTLILMPIFAAGWIWRGVLCVVAINGMVYDWMSWPNSATVALFAVAAAFAQADQKHAVQTIQPAGQLVPFKLAMQRRT